ncbi:MAG: SDR family oxidoreductase [Phycisphaerales bacterium]|nr:MAG: SDR family oxidoreductase [Phycisphaerales bacterium]
MPEHDDRQSPVAIITGGGSGIGLATATRLAGEGWNLVLAGRNAEKLHHAAETLEGRAITVQTHVERPADASRMIDRAIDHFGRLDALVNNAGYAPLVAIDETTPEQIQQCYAVNAMGPAYAIARAWPHFVLRKSGCIVNISTMGTDDPFPGFFAYAASKAPCNVMARSCANEGAEHNIRAFAVAPGAVETEMLRSIFDEKTIPADKTMDPDKVAEVVCDCILGKRDDDNGKTIFMPG